MECLLIPFEHLFSGSSLETLTVLAWVEVPNYNFRRGAALLSGIGDMWGEGRAVDAGAGHDDRNHEEQK